jgi:hypothetical protein
VHGARLRLGLLTRIQVDPEIVDGGHWPAPPAVGARRGGELHTEEVHLAPWLCPA